MAKKPFPSQARALAGFIIIIIFGMASFPVGGRSPEAAVASESIATAQPVVDVGVRASTFYDRVAPGGRLYWLATITNNGVLTANNVQIGFVFPTGVMVNACISESGACGGQENNRTVTLTSLAPRQTRSALFTTTVDAAVAPGTGVSATATLEAVANDENQNNNTSTALVTIAQTAEVLRAKSNGKIVYQASKISQSTAGIYTIDPDGANETRLPAIGGLPTWSPDGTKLAFLDVDTTPPSNSIAIFVSNPDGSGKVKAASDPSSGLNRGFSWSPDGSQIVYSNATNGAISIARADGGGQSQLPNSPHGAETPEMSPNATRIVFTQAGEIWIVNPDGGGLRKIVARAAPGEQYTAPHWSPDGSKILFTRSLGNQADAMLVNPDGTGLTRAFNIPYSANLSWSPDGQKVAFTSKYQDSLYTINYDGTNLLRLAGGAVNYGAPNWQPLAASGFVKPLLDPPTFSISGSVLREDGFSPSFTLRISGGANGAIEMVDSTPSTPDRYTFVRLPKGRQYTITPDSVTYTFEPASRVYDDLAADILDADFQGVLRYASISGRVVDEQDRGIAGLLVNINGPTLPIPAETNADGEFSFNNLVLGGTFRVIPGAITQDDRFTPNGVSFPNLSGNATALFKGPRSTLLLEGAVIDALNGPVRDVTISISGGDGERTTVTNADGKYSFGQTPVGYRYTLKAEKPVMNFLPASRVHIHNTERPINFYSSASRATAVSAASFSSQDLAAGTITALYGERMAETVNAPSSQPLPTELDGISVTLNGRHAFDRRCQLFFISPTQINFLIPIPVSPFDEITGDVLVTVKRNERVVAVGEMRIERNAPSLFSANSNGYGAAAAVALRVKANGEQVFESITQFSESENRFTSIPIDLSNPAEQVFLILYGTGLQDQNLSNLGVIIDQDAIGITFAGPQYQFPGLDQINVPLPRSLIGRGIVDVRLYADGKVSNPVQVAFK